MKQKLQDTEEIEGEKNFHFPLFLFKYNVQNNSGITWTVGNFAWR